MKHETISLEELAEALGMSPERLKRSHRRLHARSGMPLPLTHGQRGGNWRWPGLVTRLWLRTGGLPASPSPAHAGLLPVPTPGSSVATGNPANPGHDFLSSTRAALRRQYGIEAG